jgi:hypothetical protein
MLIPYLCVVQKNGVTRAMLRDVSCAVVSSKAFQPYWIQYNSGSIAVGIGREPSSESMCYRYSSRHDDDFNIVENVSQHFSVCCLLVVMF